MAEGTRIARAAGAAALSTLAALTMHVLAGGHAPAAAGVLVPLAVAFAVGVQLAGRPLGRLRLALLLGASQLAFHAAFSFGGSAAPAAHAHHGAVTLGPVELAGDGGSMPVAHVAAALVSYAAIRRADSLVRALRRLATLVSRAISARLRLGTPRVTPTGATAVVLAPRPGLTGRLAVRSPATRGPPGIA
ncbi:hypothetical protein [Demequina lignilytica]|uniref:MFS transporter n=1 Tax=Demequina lignilytica TaxID=3051663 RepID=A0AB35MHU2_9MICO|nr:hypothetical protein [Demequina sp. SYSU T0a273]MDN4483354.1 hypothetical protein [Demequina sp. SYSU T0a273]